MPVAPWSRGAVETLEAAHRRGRRDRLPADAQGDRGRRRARHPRRHQRRRAGRRLRAHQPGGGRAPSAAASCSWSGWSPAPGTSRSRSSPTARAPPGRSACATARCSGATRRSSRSPRRRCSARSRPPSSRRRPSGWPSRSATAARRPSSSSTTPASGCSRSSRSTPGCRSSTRSPSSTTGFDLVKAQLHVASGGRLDGRAAAPSAGTPSRPGSTPRTPTATSRPPPAGSPGWTCRPGRASGSTPASARATPIPADFDSMIAKIIAYGRDRDEALGRLRRAMADTTVIIEGGATNKSFVLDLLDQPEVIDASADTGWIDRVRGEGRLVSHRHSAVALAAAAIEAYEEEERVEQQRLLATAFGGRPQVQHDSGRPLDLKLRGAGYRMRVARVGAAPVPGRHRSRRRRCAPPTSRSTASTGTPGRSPSTARGYRLLTGTHGPIHLVEVDGVTHRVSRDEGGVLRSPDARAGRRDPASRSAPRSRRAHRCSCWRHEDGDGAARAVPGPAQGVRGLGRQPGRGRRAAAAAGAARRRRRRADGRRPPPSRRARTCPPSPPGPGARAGRSAARRTCAACCSASTSTRTTSAGCSTTTSPRAGPPPRPASGRWPRRSSCSTVFADLAELSRNRPTGEDGAGDQPRAQRPRVLPHLPAEPRRRAGRATGAVPGHDWPRRSGTTASPTWSAPPSSRRPCSASSWPSSGPPPTPRSSRRCCAPGCGSRRRTQSLREPAGLALERLVAATQVRFPVVADLARGVVFAWFAQPLLLRNRARRLRRRPQAPALPGRATRTRRTAPSGSPRWCAAPSRWCGVLGQRLVRDHLDNSVDAGGADPALLRQQGPRRRPHPPRSRTARSWSPNAPTPAVVSAAVRFDALGDALRRARPSWPTDGTAVDADIYLAWEDQPDDFDAMAARAAARSSTRTRCRAAGPPAHHHRRRAAAAR